MWFFINVHIFARIFLKFNLFCMLYLIIASFLYTHFPNICISVNVAWRTSLQHLDRVKFRRIAEFVYIVSESANWWIWLQCILNRFSLPSLYAQLCPSQGHSQGGGTRGAAAPSNQYKPEVLPPTKACPPPTKILATPMVSALDFGGFIFSLETNTAVFAFQLKEYSTEQIPS